jgi:hypothetical protein
MNVREVSTRERYEASAKVPRVVAEKLVAREADKRE